LKASSFTWSQLQLNLFSTPFLCERQTKYLELYFFLTVSKKLRQAIKKISRAGKQLSNLNNKKHGYHVWTFFIVVCVDGKIVYISNVHRGIEHDKTHWNESSTLNELKQVYQNSFSRMTMCIGGDNAY
jgi:hypothetical protein